MVKIKVKDVEYNLKFSVGFWESVQNQIGVTMENMQEKLNENFGKNAAVIVFEGIYWAEKSMDSTFKRTDMKLVLDDIKADLDASVVDVFEEALVDSMTKAQKKIHEKMLKAQEDALESLNTHVAEVMSEKK